MGRRLVWIGGGAVAVLVIAVAVLWFLLQSTGAATLDDAQADFAADPASAAAPVDGAPAPGVYSYAVLGEERLARDQIGVSRSVDGEAPLIVRSLPEGYETELRYSADHTEKVTYRVDSEGASALSGESEVKALGIGEVRPRDWSPPPLRLPAGAAVGDEWSGTYKSGTLDVAIDSEVLREDTVDVEGEMVPVLVIEATQTISGEYSGPRTEEFWLDPETNLIVRYVIRSSLEGPIDFSIDAEHVLTSLTPRP